MSFYAFLPKLLNMSLTASVAIVCVLLLRLLLKRAPKVISYALWAVVLFRLLCPISIESGLSLFGLMDAPTVNMTARTSSIEYVPENIVHTEVPEVTFPVPGVSKTIKSELPKGEKQPVANPLEAPVAIGTYVWLAGVLVMAAYSLVSWLRLRKKLLIVSMLQGNIYLADEITTPFVMGLIRPKIYLPSDTEERQQSYIILHEQHHIRRGDHIIKALAFLALSIHWFNPLVWVAFLYSNKDMEMSCDEAVVKKLGDGILADYAASLLSLASGKRIIAGMPLAFGEGDTGGRIRNLAKWKKPAFWVVLVAAVACIVLGIGLLTNPTKENVSDHDGDGYYLMIGAESEIEFSVPEESLPAGDKSQDESAPAAVKWTYSPMMSATWHAAFHFNFGLENYSHIEASCDNGILWNLQAPGQPREKEMRFEQGEPLCWTPGIEGESLTDTTESAIVTFTVYDGEEVVSRGKLDIVRTGQENGQSFYEAQLTDTPILALWQEEGSLDASIVMAGNGNIVSYSDLNHNRINERIVVRETEANMLYELLVVENGTVIWSTEAGLPHVGWNTIMHYEEGGESYLVEYKPQMYQGVGTYSCEMFSLEEGQKSIKRQWTVDFELPVEEPSAIELTPQMEHFAEEVGLLLRNCTVLLSTEQGILVNEFAMATALPQIYPVRFDPDEIWAAIDGTDRIGELTANAASFPEEPIELMFASGAGGWGSLLTLQPDGSFTGDYRDSEMGTNASEYPNGTCYVSIFEGRFTDIQQISDYAWSMKLADLTTENEVEESWIEDGVRYIASEAYGVSGGEEFILYAPGMPADELSAECRTWWPDAFLWRNGEQEQLEGWGLCNVNTGQGFFTDWLVQRDES